MLINSIGIPKILKSSKYYRFNICIINGLVTICFDLQVELQINTPTNVPEWLFVLFAVCTTVLVAVHIFALMISTYILPNIEAIAKLEICEMVSESPHERMKGFIEIAWAFSTVLGNQNFSMLKRHIMV